MWVILEKIGQKVLYREDRLRKRLGLSEAEYRGLRSIVEKEKITCQEFSERMRLSLSRASRVVELLCNKKFVERADCPSDRRCKNIWLTKKGFLVRQKIEREMQKWEKALAACYPEKKLRQLRGDLKKVADKL
jgi:DNA-binding MarR family transcriptional regulator